MKAIGREVNLSELKVSKDNPRKSFNENKMADLTNSIKEKGVIEPIVIRPSNGKYEIVCGERRFRASQKTGIKTIPAIIRELTDGQAMEIRAVENLQREDLCPLEEAQAFKTMLEKCKYTQDDLATKVGKSRKYIIDRIRLLELSADIQQGISKELITPGHGIVLLRLEDPEERQGLYKSIIDEKLSVRSAENALDQCGKKLNNAPFDTKECQKCEHNGSKQKDFFDKDTNLKGRCLNIDCYKKKREALVNKSITELRKKGVKIVTEQKIKSELGGTKYDNSIHINSEYTRHKNDLGKAYQEKCKAGCSNYICVIEQDRYGDDAKVIAERCFDPGCFRKLIRTPSAKAGDDYGKQLKKVKTQKRVAEAKRAFWIKNVATAKNKRAMSSIMLDILLSDLGSSTANKLLPFKVPEWGYSWSIKKLYELGEAEINKLTVLVISKKPEVLDDRALKFLSETLGFNIKKNFMITETYLKAHTKDQLVSLAKQIGLDKYLKTKKVCDALDGKKKTDLLDYFLKKGFKLEGVVPKEIK